MKKMHKNFNSCLLAAELETLEVFGAVCFSYALPITVLCLLATSSE